MTKAIIKLAYRQVISAASKGGFEQNVFNTTYLEFLLKSQTYNQQVKFKTFSEMKANDGRANSLHYKLSFAALPYIEMLQKQIPVLHDNAGKSLPFDIPQFELIESDITNKQAHKIAINYQTDDLTLIAMIGEYIVLAAPGVPSIENQTITVKMCPELSIIAYQEVVPDEHIVNSNEALLSYHTKGNSLL